MLTTQETLLWEETTLIRRPQLGGLALFAPFSNFMGDGPVAVGSLPGITCIEPLYDLLGTPEEHKELKLYDTDHIPPRDEFIKEILVWLDRYMGPTRPPQ